MNNLEMFRNEEEKFWKSFSSKSPKRFIVYINDSQTKEQIIPPYIIHAIERPTFYWENDKKIWNNVVISCYEVLGMNILMKVNSAKKFTVRVRELYEVGNVAEEWELIDCRFVKTFPMPLSWASEIDVISSLQCQIQFNSIKVNTNVEGK